MSSIEKRVSRLEEAVFGSSGELHRAKNWRRTVGMFRGDPIMKQVIDEASRLREEERQQAHDMDDECGG